MKYLFELSHHHDNPLPPSYLSVEAETEEMAVIRAITLGLEQMYGTTYNIKRGDLTPLFRSDSEYVIVQGTDEYEESEFVHFWREMDIDTNGNPTWMWNFGFGIGDSTKNSTDKYENNWLKLISVGQPVEREVLLNAITAEIDNIRTSLVSTEELVDLYKHVIELT